MAHKERSLSLADLRPTASTICTLPYARAHLLYSLHAHYHLLFMFLELILVCSAYLEGLDPRDSTVKGRCHIKSQLKCYLL